MVILLTYPEAFPCETELLNKMLEQNEGLLLHIRKPEWNENQMRELLTAIEPTFRKRLVIHSHHHLAKEFGLKGIHLTEKDRLMGIWGENVVSTSFHDLKTARKDGSKFEYFFCSPVFESISKPDYSVTEDWNITSESDEFRSQAVALGGVNPQRFPQLREKGFEHAALLGHVWQSTKPLSQLNSAVEACNP